MWPAISRKEKRKKKTEFHIGLFQKWAVDSAMPCYDDHIGMQGGIVFHS